MEHPTLGCWRTPRPCVVSVLHQRRPRGSESCARRHSLSASILPMQVRRARVDIAACAAVEVEGDIGHAAGEDDEGEDTQHVFFLLVRRKWRSQ
jgi:hypothetical protein